jgi:hypothetical protein
MFIETTNTPLLAREYFLVQRVNIGFDVRRTSYSMDNGISLPCSKVAGA